MRAAICAAAIGLALTACGRKEPSPPAAAPAAKADHPVQESQLNTLTLAPETEKRLAIKVEAIARRPVSKTREFGGEVIVPAGMTLDVASPIAGTLAAGGGPRPGQAVRRGEMLFRVMPLVPSERDVRIDAERDLATARAAVEAARKKSERAEQLLADGSGSRRSAEEARAEVASAEAGLRAAEERMAVVNRSRNAASELVVSAPIDGIVESVQAAPGQSVAAGAKLAQIARLDRLWVRVPIYAGDAPDVDPNQPAIVLRLGETNGEGGIPARRVAAPPTATPSASAVDTVYELPAGSHLQPGERVHVRVPGRSAETALVVPESAILHDINGGTWVYERTAPQAYARQRVEVSDMSGGFATLSRGPREGSPVVTAGAAELYGIEFGVGK
jgi:membrane fusion protein, heavy metal efflux system